MCYTWLALLEEDRKNSQGSACGTVYNLMR